MEEETVRARRFVVKVVAIDATYVTVVWADQQARIDLRFLSDEVRQSLRLGAEYNAQVHGNNVYNLRPVAASTSIRPSSRHRLIVR